MSSPEEFQEALSIVEMFSNEVAARAACETYGLDPTDVLERAQEVVSQPLNTEPSKGTIEPKPINHVSGTLGSLFVNTLGDFYDF
ncbi:MAG: hypothetical protein QG629_736 [Patescibacteria group bacterium]|nr:hypothetical protein [Patescibacteria group bacterium]